MKKGLKLGLIIGGVAVAGIGTYLLINKFKKPTDNTDFDSQIFQIEQESQNQSNPLTPTDKKKDFNKRMMIGDSSESVTSIQKLLNSIIRIARTSKKNSDATKQSRRKKIADFSYIVEDGKFGSKTEKVLMVIMGSKSASINELLKKQKDFKNAYK